MCCRANREVATLILPQHLWVRVYVPEPWLGLIKIGDQVRVRVDSFPGKDFHGTVEQINRAGRIHAAQRADGRGPNPAGFRREGSTRRINEDKLRAGMSADAYFPTFRNESIDAAKR